MATSVFMEVVDPDATIGTHPVVTLTDNITETVYQQLYIPHEFSSLVAIRLFMVGGNTGNMVAAVSTSWGKTCASESYSTHTSNIPVTVYPIIINNITCLDISAAFAGIAADDLIGIAFTRYGGHASDTINTNVSYLGLELTFN